MASSTVEPPLNKKILPLSSPIVREDYPSPNPVAGSRGDRSPTEVRRDQGPNDTDHSISRGPRRDEAKILAIAPDQVNERGVINRVAHAAANLNLLVIDPIVVGHSTDIGGAAREADQLAMKRGQVFQEMLTAIALRVERDENRCHIRRRGSEHLQRQPHRLQVSRTNVRAAGVAEINQHELSAKIRVAANLSVMIR